MDIRLDKHYAITSDSYQMILNKIRIPQTGEFKGKEVYSVIGYYVNIEGALNGYVDQKTLDSKATTVKQLLDEVRALREFIKQVAY